MRFVVEWLDDRKFGKVKSLDDALSEFRVASCEMTSRQGYMISA
jgi:hypothetical protein